MKKEGSRMKKTNFKNVLTTLLVVLLMGVLTACGGSGGPVEYDAPSNAPYKGLYVVDKMNSSSSYSNKNGVNNFNVTMKWKTEDESIDYADFTDEYYLEWSSEEFGPFELCEPINDMSGLKNNKHLIRPGENADITFDVDSYFDGLPMGYYRFVKVLDVVKKDGSSEQMVVSFEFDMNN